MGITVDRGLVGARKARRSRMAGEWGEAPLNRFRLRRAEPEDFDEIFDLDRECFGDGAAGPLPQEADGWQWWLAEVNYPAGLRAAVAYAGARPSYQFPAEAIYLARAGVIPEARGGGLQKRLIRARLRWGRECGFAWAITDTATVASMRSLIACGFRPYEPARPWALSYSTYWIRKL